MAQMWMRLSFTIVGLFLAFPISSPAGEPAGSAVQARQVILSDEDIARLNEIESPESVRILQLIVIPDSKTQIDDEALKPLERFQEVRTLVLSCPSMTDNAFKYIAKLQRLECLIIYQCKITDLGMKDLKVLSQLQAVGLFETSVTEEGIVELKAALDQTYFERGSVGKNGKIFDADGCIRSSFLRRHLTLPRSGPM